MGHLTVKNYNLLYKRMDQSINGVVDSTEFYEILRILFTDEEALLCSFLPLLPASCEKIAGIWELPEKEAESILQTLVQKGLVYEDDFDGSTLYHLALPVFGFFEFSLMRNDGRFDRKALSRLYDKYISDDLSFVRKYFATNPALSRTYVQEDSLPDDMTSEILPYEKISHIVGAAENICVGTCFCRHKMEHAGKACDAPQDVCLSFGNIAKTLIHNGIAREISKTEALDIIDLCIQRGLVQIGDNIKDKTAVICNCCGCCCELLRSYKKTGMRTIVATSDYIADIDTDICSECGLCAHKCPVDAISISEDKPSVQKEWCLGCGVCAHFCETNACNMLARPEKRDIPENTIRKVFLAAIYQEKIGNYVFDNQKSFVAKISRKAVNGLVKLTPVKWALLQKPIQDYLLRLVLKKYNI